MLQLYPIHPTTQDFGRAKRHQDKLLRHLAEHTGVLLFPCLMSACIKSFATAAELEAHLLQHMDVPAPHRPAPGVVRSDPMDEVFVRGRPDEHVPHPWRRTHIQRLAELTRRLASK